MPLSMTTRLSFTLQQGEPIVLSPEYRDLVNLAHNWDFRMRNRSRWITNEAARSDMERLSRQDLAGIGLAQLERALARVWVVAVVQRDVAFAVSAHDDANVVAALRRELVTHTHAG